METFLLSLAELSQGHSQHAGRLQFAVLDSAGDQEPHHVEVTSDVDNYGSRIYVSSRVVGTADSCCHRCLERFERAIEASFKLVLQPGAEASDGEVVGISEDAREFDLGPFVREAVILEEPIRVLCQADCRGLCSQCGQNLNLGTCACKPPEDPRWDALKKLSPGSDS